MSDRFYHTLHVLAGLQRSAAAKPWAALSGAVGATLFGTGPHGLIVAAAKLMLLDVATGMMKGAVRQSLSSRIATMGFKKKLAAMGYIVLATQADSFLKTGGLLQQLITTWIIGIEILSVIENLATSGLVLPEPLMRVLTLLIKNAEDRPLTGLSSEHHADEGSPAPAKGIAA